MENIHIEYKDCFDHVCKARLLAAEGGSNVALMLEPSMLVHGAADVSVRVLHGKHLAASKCSKDGKTAH